MPGHLFSKRKASPSVAESARVVGFDEFFPEEEFYKCVHLTTGHSVRRCRNSIKQDSAKARCLYLKIRSSLVSGTSVQDLLSDLAKVTLCNHVHRPRDGTRALYSGIAQKWSNDIDPEKGALEDPAVERVVNEAVVQDAGLLLQNPVVLSARNGHQESSTILNDPSSAGSEILDEEELCSKVVTCEDDSLLDRPAVLVRRKAVDKEKTNPSHPGPRESGPRNKAIPASLPPPLPERVTRSGTFSYPDDEYWPFRPKLLNYTPSQLIHYTNTSLLSVLSGELKPQAKLDGYVYIFTRPDNPSLVKIGFAIHSGEARVARWGRNCCYEAHHEFDTGKMPHAWLVERLAQEELKQYRKIEQRCKWKAACSTKHQEWFELGVEEARMVVERWASWITKYQPWGPDHVLKPNWRALLDKYRRALNGPDRDTEMWERWARMEQPRALMPVLRSETSSLDVEEQPPIKLMHTSSSAGTSPLSIIMQTSTAKGTEYLRPLKVHTKIPMSFNNDCSQASSPSTSPICSTTTPLIGSIRSTFQTPPETIRVSLKSAISNLDCYLTASSSKNRANPRFTIRMDRKSIALAWGELDEGYCTA